MYLLLFSTYEYFACMYCACSAFGDQKRVSDPLELELEMAVSHDVGEGI